MAGEIESCTPETIIDLNALLASFKAASDAAASYQFAYKNKKAGLRQEDYEVNTNVLNNIMESTLQQVGEQTANNLMADLTMSSKNYKDIKIGTLGNSQFTNDGKVIRVDLNFQNATTRKEAEKIGLLQRISRVKNKKILPDVTIQLNNKEYVANQKEFNTEEYERLFAEDKYMGHYNNGIYSRTNDHTSDENAVLTEAQYIKRLQYNQLFKDENYTTMTESIVSSVMAKLFRLKASNIGATAGSSSATSDISLATLAGYFKEELTGLIGDYIEVKAGDKITDFAFGSETFDINTNDSAVANFNMGAADSNLKYRLNIGSIATNALLQATGGVNPKSLAAEVLQDMVTNPSTGMSLVNILASYNRELKGKYAVSRKFYAAMTCFMSHNHPDHFDINNEMFKAGYDKSSAVSIFVGPGHANALKKAFLLQHYVIKLKAIKLVWFQSDKILIYDWDTLIDEYINSLGMTITKLGGNQVHVHLGYGQNYSAIGPTSGAFDKKYTNIFRQSIRDDIDITRSLSHWHRGEK